MNALRLDKWLWAARFFKTRSQAKQAIEGGKVQQNSQRCKVSKEIKVGDTLTIRQGHSVKTVIILTLSDKRKAANEAQLLYQETNESLQLRQVEAEKRALSNQLTASHRPDKKERRQIHRFKRQEPSD